MRRLVVYLLVVALLGSVTVAKADIDLLGLSTDELIELRNEIDKIIGLPIKGRYITGVDIKEGYYIVLYKESGLSYSKISVYNTLEDAENSVPGEKKKQYFTLFDGGTATIHLMEGNVLEITNDSVIISPVSTPSWMP